MSVIGWAKSRCSRTALVVVFAKLRVADDVDGEDRGEAAGGDLEARTGVGFSDVRRALTYDGDV